MTEEVKKLIESAEVHECKLSFHLPSIQMVLKSDFDRVVEELTKWYDAKDDKPTTDQETEGIFYSDYVLMRLKGYQHPFVGYYVKADGVEFFDFIQPSFQDGLEQSDITEWRYIY